MKRTGPKRLILILSLMLFLTAGFYHKQILLKFIGWKAETYCKEAFGAKLLYEEILWHEGKIIIKKGKLIKPFEMETCFEEASLLPALHFKKRLFGGDLRIDGLKIVHRKKELRPVLTPPSPSPSFKLFKLHLDTTIERGELSLYDHLSKSHIFQSAHFDLSHHVNGKETCGTISLELDADTPKFVTHFLSKGDSFLELTAHFHSHKFPDLAHLVNYFFQSYLPEPAFHWDIITGTIDGDMELSLVKGTPLKMKGRLILNDVQGENPSLKLFTEFEHLNCTLDIDLSTVSSINGDVSLSGGRLALLENNTLWKGIWDLKNIHSKTCVREGKVESSILQGSFMGMEGELLLDWQSQESLMNIGFRGASGKIAAILPESIKPKFAAAFPNDFFQLQAACKRSSEGLQLDGQLNICDQNGCSHDLDFGCLLGEGDREMVLEHVFPDHLNFSLSRSVGSFLDGLKEQFYLKQKRFGWFEGKQFPLEKFLTPFLLHNVPMNIAGLADFKGTFDERYLVVFYEAEQVVVDSPSFQLHAPQVKEDPLFGVSSVHYVDLKTGKHVGFLPLKEACYWQKNYDFQLEKIHALVNFDNQVIHIRKIKTCGEGVDFEGGVKITVGSLTDIDLKIVVDHLEGAADDARRFLSHFKSSFVWNLPFEGRVEGKNKPLVFHYHFSPSANLIEGRMHGEVNLRADLPAISLLEYKAFIDYDCKENKLAITRGQGLVKHKQQRVLTLTTPDVTLSNFPNCLLDFTAKLEDGSDLLLSLNGSTKQSEEGREFCITGFGSKPDEVISIRAFQRENLYDIDYSWAALQGGARLSFHEGGIVIEQCGCFANQKAALAFSGHYDFSKRCLEGEIHELSCDLGALMSSFKNNHHVWKPKGEVAGSGKFVWYPGKNFEGEADLDFKSLEFGGIHFGDGQNLWCTYSTASGLSIEGLEVEIPLENGIEKYKLGRFCYDPNREKIHFDGFDFSLPPEKLPQVAEIANTLFPGKIHPTAVKWFGGLKQDESLEGRISLEIDPENILIYLNLKDGAYFLANNRLDLKDFHLIYDPQQLNLWSQCRYLDNYYWLHLATDSRNMKSGSLSFSENELSFDKSDELAVLTAQWERDDTRGLSIKKVEGILSGMDLSLKSSLKSASTSETIALSGRIGFDPSKINHLLPPFLKAIVDRFSLSGGFALEGEFKIPKENFSAIRFGGTFLGNKCHASGLFFDAFSSHLHFSPTAVSMTKLAVKDWAGRLAAEQILLRRQEHGEWTIDLKKLSLADLRLSRVKSPWTHRSKGQKPFFRSLFIPNFMLESFSGKLGDLYTYLGSGKLEFTNLPKKTIFSNLLYLPMEITARIGLDLSNLVPVRGTIEYAIHDGKIYFTEFKEMYSDGKHSRFYLAEGSPAYVDFRGNLNFKIKMKQYNLLMKLAEFFTVSVKGTLLHPSYTLSNHSEDEDS